MKDWNDREISVGYSEGGVMAVEDFHLGRFSFLSQLY